jgi:sortase (surface protein transpeptidase)
MFDSRRLQLIGLGTIGILAVIGVILVSGGSPAGGIDLVRGGETEDPVVTGTRRMDAIDGEVAERPVDSVEAFTREHGEPPNSDFMRMRIPSIGVNAPVGLFIVDESVMPDPQGPVDVAFYDMRAWSGLGGFPGEGGNAIFGGHVDLNRPIPYAGGAHYRGPAVFWHLESLRPGDVIEIDYGGQTLRYAVAWVQELGAFGTDWYPIWSNSVAVDSITLFTCGGSFDFETGDYSHRVVVRAERV